MSTTLAVTHVLFKFNLQDQCHIPDGVTERTITEKASEEATPESSILFEAVQGRYVGMHRIFDDLCKNGYEPMSCGWHWRTNARGSRTPTVYMTMIHTSAIPAGRTPMSHQDAKRSLYPLFNNFLWQMIGHINYSTNSPNARVSFNLAVGKRCRESDGAPITRRDQLGQLRPIEADCNLAMNQSHFQLI